MARQAFAGLLWGKQFFHYDVERWLAGDPGQPPPPPGRGAIRNGDWQHLNNHEVILMPDPWEYPWFAAWDLAFHCVTIAHIDPAFAKAQLVLLLREWYMHPNGQIPAYEWNFSDVNPPVHAWAAIRVFEIDGGTDFTLPGQDLPQAADELHLVGGQQGPRRQQPVPGRLHGAGQHRPARPLDAAARPRATSSRPTPPRGWRCTPWTCSTWRCAWRVHDRSYEDVATKFFEHFLAIAGAANNAGLWDDEDAYFYDVLHLADGTRRSDQGQVPGRAGADPRGARLRPGLRLRAAARLPGARAVVPATTIRSTWQLFHIRDVDGVAAPAARARPAASGWSGCWTTSSTKTDCSRRTGSGRSRRGTASTRSASGSAASTASVDYEPAESTTEPVRRQLQLARSDLDAAERAADRGAARLRPAHPRRAHGGVPDRLGHPRCRSARPRDDISRRLVSIFLPGRTAAAPCTAGTTCWPPTRGGGTSSRSTSTSTATPAWVWAPRTRPGGRRSSPTSIITTPRS